MREQTVRRLLRDRQLIEKLGFSKSELHRRRISDPDFPPSFLIGPHMRVSEEQDVDRYIGVLKDRAARKLPTPGRCPRGRPRKNSTDSPSKGECASGASG
jgi:predicted DNA-binding transcriptional regulator AlpA